ncbi:hypothetical protein A2713_00295 [candidate division WWE3 bacterium RIFCSPHIGHO2_01_FULL_35_17]|uniref:GlcNAc-PI de-N-acetylase n=1 Tax=candidate division WWE3 bacterium RIFCSPHIGHO2_01_FULL_35_17 TaxID=1802614 RepID=A0A1F4URE1_UNCKA|nr:MAG: hypothetical protein A2713_00295 [candidate division WWE3 bacterium RIFCSPHIGHO2_01_FULL_35_17]
MINNMEHKRVLVISAHPDDYELGMGMRIRKYANENVQVVAVTATKGEYKDSPNGREDQEKKAAKILGVSNQINLKFPCAELSNCSNELRVQLEIIIKEFKPHVIYTIYDDNSHIDHHILSVQSSIAARSTPNLIYYKVVGGIGFMPNMFFCGDNDLLNAKISSLKCFSKEIKKAGAIDIKRSQVFAKYEISNYLHHSCLSFIKKYKNIENSKHMLFESFHIERMVSI